MPSITICSDFGAQENKICHCFHFFLSICHEVMGPDAMILVFLVFLRLSFKAAFSLSSFSLKRLCSYFLLFAIRVVLLAYLRLLIFFPVILILVCNSSSLAFWVMYSACKFSKQGDDIQPCHTPFPILNQLFHVQFCYFLTHIQVLRRQVKVIWFSHLFKNFPQFWLSIAL